MSVAFVPATFWRLWFGGCGFGVELFALFAELFDVGLGVFGFVDRFGDADGGRGAGGDFGGFFAATTGDQEQQDGEQW
jgi:hypothetical protein